jgi:hypothetical protein
LGREKDEEEAKTKAERTGWQQNPARVRVKRRRAGKGGPG